MSYRLDAMADAHDVFALFAHLVDELHGRPTFVQGLRELSGRTIKGTSETIALKCWIFTFLTFIT